MRTGAQRRVLEIPCSAALITRNNSPNAEATPGVNCPCAIASAHCGHSQFFAGRAQRHQAAQIRVG